MFGEEERRRNAAELAAVARAKSSTSSCPPPPPGWRCPDPPRTMMRRPPPPPNPRHHHHHHHHRHSHDHPTSTTNPNTLGPRDDAKSIAAMPGGDYPPPGGGAVFPVMTPIGPPPGHDHRNPKSYGGPNFYHRGQQQQFVHHHHRHHHHPHLAPHPHGMMMRMEWYDCNNPHHPTGHNQQQQQQQQQEEEQNQQFRHQQSRQQQQAKLPREGEGEECVAIEVVGDGSSVIGSDLTAAAAAAFATPYDRVPGRPRVDRPNDGRRDHDEFVRDDNHDNYDDDDDDEASLFGTSDDDDDDDGEQNQQSRQQPQAQLPLKGEGKGKGEACVAIEEVGDGSSVFGSDLTAAAAAFVTPYDRAPERPRVDRPKEGRQDRDEVVRDDNHDNYDDDDNASLFGTSDDDDDGGDARPSADDADDDDASLFSTSDVDDFGGDSRPSAAAAAEDDGIRPGRAEEYHRALSSLYGSLCSTFPGDGSIDYEGRTSCDESPDDADVFVAAGGGNEFPQQQQQQQHRVESHPSQGFEEPPHQQQRMEMFEPPQLHGSDEGSIGNYVYSSDEGSIFSLGDEPGDGSGDGAGATASKNGGGSLRKISPSSLLARGKSRDGVSLGIPSYRIQKKKDRHLSSSSETSLIRKLPPPPPAAYEMKMRPPSLELTKGEDQHHHANTKRVSFVLQANDDHQGRCLGRSARALDYRSRMASASSPSRQRASWKGTTTEIIMVSTTPTSNASCLHVGKWNEPPTETTSKRHPNPSTGADIVRARVGKNQQRKQPHGQQHDKKEDQWNKNFLVMEAYIRHHGTCDVPNGHSLASWVRRQRNSCRRWIRNNNHDINEVDAEEEQRKMLDRHIRISRLQSIGFDWDGGDGMGLIVQEALATEQMLLGPRNREKLEAALALGKSRSSKTKLSPTRHRVSALDSISSKYRRRPRQHRSYNDDKGEECEFLDSSSSDPSLRSSRRTNESNDKKVTRMVTDSSLSDDGAGITAVVTAQNSRKRSRSGAFLHGKDRDDGVPKSTDNDEFIDDIPDCVSWNHRTGKISTKRYNANLDRITLLVAEGMERYMSSKLRRPLPSEASPSSSTMNTALPLPSRPEGGGCKKSCSNLERAEGPLVSGWGVVDIVQSVYDNMAKADEGKQKHVDSSHSDLAPAPSQSVDQPPMKKNVMEHTSSSSPMKSLTRSFFLDTRSQIGLNTPVLNVGQRVFAPWCNGWTVVKKDVSSIHAYYYPGVILSHRIVYENERAVPHAGSSTTSSSPVVLYDVRFEDGDITTNIDGSLVMSRETYLNCNLKPLLTVGDEVYAAWWEDSSRTSAPSWYPGVITGYRDLEYGGQYGLIRYYDVTFDDGDELDEIQEIFVMEKSEYLISTSKVCNDGNIQSEWLGVRNQVDKNSIDEWATDIGWYVATIDGQEQSFSFLSDALRAYDTYTVRCKGDQTKITDLNLPEEWAFPSPSGICPPVHLTGDDHDCIQPKLRHKSSTKGELLHSSNQAASSKQRQRKCETDPFSSNLASSASAIHTKHINHCKEGEKCQPAKDLNTRTKFDTPTTNSTEEHQIHRSMLHASSLSIQTTMLSNMDPESMLVIRPRSSLLEDEATETEQSSCRAQNDMIHDHVYKHPNGIPPTLDQAWRDQKVAQSLAKGQEREANDELEKECERSIATAKGAEIHDGYVNEEGMILGIETMNKPTSPEASSKACDNRISLGKTNIIDLVDPKAKQAENHGKLTTKASKYPALPAEGLPSNWQVRRIPRKKGSHVDSYWYSPIMGYCFRSKKEVNNYLGCLKRTNGDEVSAIYMFHRARSQETSMNMPHDSPLTSSIAKSSSLREASQSCPNVPPHDSPSTSCVTKYSPPKDASRFQVIEFIKPSTSSTSKKKDRARKNKKGQHKSREKVDCLTTGFTKPIIKKGDKVYACWGGPDGLGKDWFPGRVWDVTEYAVGEYGPVKKYDVVFDDGDTESNVDEIWVCKKDEYEMLIKKPEAHWIGVTNITFPESKDKYARFIGWFKLSCGGDHPVYSSLGDSLRAHDMHVIMTKGFDNIVASDLNFPEEHGVI